LPSGVRKYRRCRDLFASSRSTIIAPLDFQSLAAFCELEHDPQTLGDFHLKYAQLEIVNVRRRHFQEDQGAPMRERIHCPLYAVMEGHAVSVAAVNWQWDDVVHSLSNASFQVPYT
jgi:hypothetical protein